VVAAFNVPLAPNEEQRWIPKRKVEYRQADKDDWSKLSDHCPIMVEMWF